MLSDRDVQYVFCTHLGHKANGVKYIFPFDPHGHSSDSLMSFSSTKTQVQIFYCLASHKTQKDLNEKNNSIPEESVSSQEIRFSSLYSSN